MSSCLLETGDTVFIASPLPSPYKPQGLSRHRRVLFSCLWFLHRLSGQVPVSELVFELAGFLAPGGGGVVAAAAEVIREDFLEEVTTRLKGN